MKPIKLTALLLLLGLGTSIAMHAAEPATPEKPTAAQLAAVKKILKEVPLIDGHNDTPWQYRKRSLAEGALKDGTNLINMNIIDLASDTSKIPSPMVTDIARMRAGGMGGQFWSVYIPATMLGSNAVRAVMEQIDVVHKMVAKYPDAFELALTAADVERIHREGKIASLIGMEGGHSINNSIETLRKTYALGARYMTLTHTKNVEWADSANDEPRHHGLTPFGVEIVHEMNRLGMLVDLSHVSIETMNAALDASKAPVIFSHSCVRALCDNARNVPDEVLKRMPKNGGVVMITFFPEYLTVRGNNYFNLKQQESKRVEKLFPNDPEARRTEMRKWDDAHPLEHAASLSDVADHIDHVRKIAGIDYVGLGGDYEGFDGTPDGLEDVTCYPALLAELMRRGYTAGEIKKVAGLNVLRVMKQAEAVSAKLKREKQ